MNRLYELVEINVYARTLTLLSRPYLRRVSGMENVPAERGNVIFIANHNSLLDSLLLTPRLVLRARSVVYIFGDRGTWKRNMLRGSVSRLMANGILVDRSDPKDVRRGLKRCITTLKDGGRVLIFPEGTRGVPEEIGEFKEGVYLVAFRARATIVPVALVNVSVLSHKGKRFPSLLGALSRLSINVGPGIGYAEYGRYRKRPEQFCAFLRGRVCELYRQAEGDGPGGYSSSGGSGDHVAAFVG